MKALKNHVILFDADCPMCSIYTLAFLKTGMLDSDGRTAYQQFSQQACPMLDRQRAVNEIALINKETGEVTYGVESLFKVFAANFPILKPLLSFAPFIWLMRKVYAFISFNRRVIIPAPVTANYADLQPTFKLHYRLAYLCVTWVLTSTVLARYTGLMTGLLPEGNVYREFLVCGGQIFFQAAVISNIDKRKTWEYLGNMMTISFAGAMLLLPVLLFSKSIGAYPLFYASWFLAVAGLMLLEHIRRSKILQIGIVLTISWVLYRILVLLLIFSTSN